MGLFDSLATELKGALGQVTEGEIANLLPIALAATNLGSLQGIVNQLQQAGLGQQVQAWINGGEAPHVTPDMLRSALDEQHVQQLAQHFGVNPDVVLNLLAQHLPTAVAQGAQSGTVTNPN
jgi:uncharacterized protein YidB (DUF937 family)